MGKKLIPGKPEDILALLDKIIAGDDQNDSEWGMSDPSRTTINTIRTQLINAIEDRDLKRAAWRESVQTLGDVISTIKPTIRRGIDHIRSHWGRENNRVLDYGISVASARIPSVIPAAPAGITAVGAGANKIKVDWSTVTGAKFYELWRAEEDPQKPGQLEWILLRTFTKTIYTDSGLTSGRRYYYKVRAANAAGIGEFSAVADCVAP